MSGVATSLSLPVAIRGMQDGWGIWQLLLGTYGDCRSPAGLSVSGVTSILLGSTLKAKFGKSFSLGKSGEEQK